MPSQKDSSTEQFALFHTNCVRVTQTQICDIQLQTLQIRHQINTIYHNLTPLTALRWMTGQLTGFLD